MSGFSPAWVQWRQRVDLDEYEERWDKHAASGANVHGEADFIHSWSQDLNLSSPCSILDAGCGMGRVGIELHHRGHDVVGVDLDPDLLARAKRRQPSVEWILADLASLDLAADGKTLERFDIVAMAGNVLPFVKTENRSMVIDRLQRHLVPGGLLIAGFSVDKPVSDAIASATPSSADYQDWCSSASLLPVAAWSSWDKAPTGADGAYRVFVHRK